jgi:hypothetical protein
MRILSQKGSGGEGSIPAGGTLAERSEHRVMAGANMGPYETVGSCLDAAESRLGRARSIILAGHPRGVLSLEKTPEKELLFSRYCSLLKRATGIKKFPDPAKQHCSPEDGGLGDLDVHDDVRPHLRR